jgi:hypothetical protein
LIDRRYYDRVSLQAAITKNEVCKAVIKGKASKNEKKEINVSREEEMLIGITVIYILGKGTVQEVVLKQFLFVLG